MDVFIPTWGADLPQTPYLMRSLDTFLAREAVSSLNLAAVDTADFYPRMRAVDTHGFASRTEYLRLGDLGLSETDGSYDRGWDLQQVAKLAFARKARTEFYMVLDSKNFALGPLGPTDLRRADGRAPWTTVVYWVHRKWWRGSIWAMNHRRFVRDDGRSVLTSATPSILHTASVCAMLDWLEQHHGESVEQFFLKKRPIRHRFMRPTEFTMYYTYLDREGLVDRYHYDSAVFHDDASQIWGGHAPEVRELRLRRILDRKTKGQWSCIARPQWANVEEADRRRLWALVSGEPA